MTATDRLAEIQARAEKAEEVLGTYLEDWHPYEDAVEDVMHGTAAADVPALVAALEAALDTCAEIRDRNTGTDFRAGGIAAAAIIESAIENALKENQ